MNNSIDCPEDDESTHPASLVTLFLNFIRLGLTAFGGPAMIPYLRRMAVNRYQWINEDDFRVGLALCQAIPGATVMQLAGYVGFRARGVAGAISTFCGFGLPAFALITGLSAVYFRFHNLPALLAAFSGLKVIVLAILLSASIDFVGKYIHGLPDKFLALAAAIAFLGNMHPALVILAAATLGIAIFRKDAEPKAVTIRARQDTHQRAALVGLTLLLPLAILVLWQYYKELYQLAILMMGVDILAFGGGFAALPIMLHEVVVRMGWLTEPVFLDGIALGQVTPGPIVLTAAFVGYGLSGVLGAFVGAIAIFTPSFLLLLWSIPFCDRLLGSRYFRRGLRASLATLAGLMAAVTGTLCLAVPWTIPAALLGAGAFAALRRNVDVLWVVLTGTGLSLVLF